MKAEKLSELCKFTHKKAKCNKMFKFINSNFIIIHTLDILTFKISPRLIVYLTGRHTTNWHSILIKD